MKLIPFHRQILVVLVLAFIAWALGAQAASDAPTVSITNNGKTTYFDRAAVANLPHVAVKTSLSGRPEMFEGVPLSSLLTSAGADVAKGIAGPELSKIVLVEAADGRQVAFSLAEVDLNFSANTIILADRQDGRELTTRDWPRIIVPNDKRIDRWLTQVINLSIMVPKH